MSELRAVILAATLILMAPTVAGSADLVVWWDKGYTPEEDGAVREMVAAFAKDGKQVDLAFYPQVELPNKIEQALEAGQPPDIAFGTWLSQYVAPWAFHDRLVNLSQAVGPFSNLFDPDALDGVQMLNGKTGQKALYGLPIGRITNNVHVWKNLLERAGFRLADIPRPWNAFWSFWCDKVQPAVRKAAGRDDIWGVGLVMSVDATDTTGQFAQFMEAYDADYVARDGKLVIDDAEIRERLVKALGSYTTIYRKGCTPPGSVNWGDSGNNQAFLEQTVVMTPNRSLSVVNALKHARPQDYYRNTATIEWPLGPNGEPFPIAGSVLPAVVFRDGDHVATAEKFVRFLVGEGWLAHYLDFSGERFLPPMSKLLQQPFWLNPSDPHHMASVMQLSSRPLAHDYAVVSGNWRHQLVDQEHIWAKAIHRIVTENIAPAQAVDEAIARIKQILAQ
jgi:multiple sugar transport system substrate-binding protein